MDETTGRAENAEIVAEGMLGVRKAAEFCGLSRTALYQAMAGNGLRYFKVGTRRLIARRDLVAWLAHTVQPAN